MEAKNCANNFYSSKQSHKMKDKLFALFFSLLAGLSPALAGNPFHNHRYDTFKVLGKSTGSDILFIGNSITNHHEWWEAFGNTHIRNRGVSGAISDQVVENLGSLICGKPGKVFLMIGTNDIGMAGINNAAHVAGNVRFIIDFIKGVSPKTDIYIQSILPSPVGTRTLSLQRETNDSLRDICAQTGATYVDLWTVLMPVATNSNNYSLDSLHCSAAAYRAWCKTISKYIGSPTTYPDNATVNYSGLTGSYGMRASSFAMLPVADGDILFVGDRMVASGEWHELLGSGKMKNRGTGWGYSVIGIDNVTRQIPAILKGRPDNGEPAKVFLYAGMADANSNATVDAIKTRYQALVAAVRKDAPNAEIYIQALLPLPDARRNASRIVPVNRALQEIAEANEKTTYVDDYTPFVKNGVADPDYINGEFLYGRGYVRLAHLLAAYIGKAAKPMPEAEAAALHDLLTARNAVAAALATAYACKAGTGVGQYPAETLQPLRDKMKEAYAALARRNITTAELNALAASLAEWSGHMATSANRRQAGH